MATKYILRAFEEVGLITLWNSSIDTKLLCVQRFIRLLAYGSSTLILVSYMSALEISKAKIGLFMTLTLIGDTLISFVLTIFADSLGRKMVLIFGAILMATAGAVFANSGNYWILLVAAIVGVISPSGNECGPFRTIEESTLAQLNAEERRGDIYAWYSLLGAAGSASGMGISGILLKYFREHLRWDELRAYRAIFWVYSGLGILLLFNTLLLSKSCELERTPAGDLEGTAKAIGEPGQTTCGRTLFKLPHFSRKSRIVIIKLCILFAIDSFGCNLTPLSWITYFYHTKFSLQDSQLGTIFFVTTIIAALSMLPASSLAKRFGNIKTMVLAHLPQAVFLCLFPLPNSVTLGITFLVLRSCTQSMDTAPRSAFLAGVVEPHERTAMMGILNIFRSSMASFGPVITGVLAGDGKLWISFVVGGLLMIVYDIGVILCFGEPLKRTKDARGKDEVKQTDLVKGDI